MQARLPTKDQTIKFVEDFFYAGSSALLLSIIHLYPAYWFISVFALLPFLWRLTRANLSGSLILGIILGACYCFVSSIQEILVSPWAFLHKLFLLSLIFSAFGMAVNRVKRYTGFNPIFVAALWLPLEYAIAHYAHLSSIFTFSETDSTLLIKIACLFGILTVSFVVVLINSLILIALKRAVQAIRSRATFPSKDNERSYLPFKEIVLQRRFYYYPRRRAPPIDAIL